MPELALQDVADPASDQIRTGSARPPARDAEPESDHGHDVHGNGGKDTHNQANNERTAFHRTAPPPLLVRLLPNENTISHRSWERGWLELIICQSSKVRPYAVERLAASSSMRRHSS